MNKFKNLTNVVIGKLGKLVHKQNCSHDLFCTFVKKLEGSWYLLFNVGFRMRVRVPRALYFHLGSDVFSVTSEAHT